MSLSLRASLRFARSVRPIQLIGNAPERAGSEKLVGIFQAIYDAGIEMSELARRSKLRWGNGPADRAAHYPSTLC